MKKALIGLVVLAVLGVGYWLISPLFIKTVSDESLKDLPNEAAQSLVVSRGEFTDGEPGHHAKGEAVLLRLEDGSYAVRFEDDFEVTNGPDLFVYLGNDGEYDSEAKLGALKGSVGGQNYIVPNSIDVGQYNEVWVWCRAFGVKFGVARLVAV